MIVPIPCVIGGKVFCVFGLCLVAMVPVLIAIRLYSRRLMDDGTQR